MKNWMIIVLCSCLALSVTACSQRNTKEQEVPQSQSNSENLSTLSGQEEPNISESSKTEMQKNQSIAEPPEETVQIAFSVPIINEMGTLLEEKINLSMYLPKEWTISETEIFNDERKVVEVLPARIIYNKNEPFEDADFIFAEAVTVRDFNAGSYPGKYYHMQNEVTEGGMTVKLNELIYCINIGDRMMLFTFYPAHGIGIGTQNEQFSSFLNTIELS